MCTPIWKFLDILIDLGVQIRKYDIVRYISIQCAETYRLRSDGMTQDAAFMMYGFTQHIEWFLIHYDTPNAFEFH